MDLNKPVTGERPEGLKLGDIARDKITGFEGVVICISDWLNGCQRVSVQPRTLKDGKTIDYEVFDAEQIEIVTVVPVAEQRKAGGEKPAPTRNADPT